MKKQIFIDIETTGLNPQKDKIIQLAYIYLENGKKKATGNLKNINIYRDFLKFLEKIVDKFDKSDFNLYKPNSQKFLPRPKERGFLFKTL